MLFQRVIQILTPNRPMRQEKFVPKEKFEEKKWREGERNDKWCKVN